MSSTLSSCSTFTANNDVASVGDTSLSRDDFELFVQDLLIENAPAADRTKIAGDDARRLLSAWVGDQLIIQFLESEGVAVTETERTSAADALDTRLKNAGVTWAEASRRISIEGQAARTVFQNTQQPGALGPFAQDISIEVDSRYGFWDRQSATVVAIG